MFAIGLSKTGTHSLVDALGALGLRVAHYPDRAVLDDPELGGFDGAADIPVAHRFEVLDRLHPGARFIYTVRDRAAWLRSCEAHFVGRPASALDAWARENRLAVYGRVRFDREAWDQAYARHHARVMTRFADRPGDLLVLDICGGEPVGALARFVGRPTPDPAAPFPRAYRTPQKAPRIDAICLAPPLADEGWSLRFGLRALERYFVDLATPWVVGDRPAWLSASARSIAVGPVDRAAPFEVRERMALRAALDADVSDPFLYVGPGQYPLNPWLAGKARRDHLETRPGFTADDWHPRARTLAPLEAVTRRRLGAGARSYEAPIPRLLTRARVAAMLRATDDVADCPLWRSEYFHRFPLEPKARAFLPDPKVVIATDTGPAPSPDALIDGVFLYHPPLPATGRTARLLASLFPTPSRFERAVAGGTP